MNREHVLALIQDSFTALRRAGLINVDLQVDEETVLLGPATVLDSIAFVSFIVEVEDRLQASLNSSDEDASLAIYEIHNFNPDKSRLTAGVLADYILHTHRPKGSLSD